MEIELADIIEKEEFRAMALAPKLRQYLDARCQARGMGQSDAMVFAREIPLKHENLCSPLNGAEGCERWKNARTINP